MSFIAHRTETPLEHVNIKQIYYKKRGRARAVVALNSDADISALLNEYPLSNENGSGKKKKIVMYLAVDWNDSSKENAGKVALTYSRWQYKIVRELLTKTFLRRTSGSLEFFFYCHFRFLIFPQRVAVAFYYRALLFKM